MSTENTTTISYSFVPVSHIVLESEKFINLKPSVKVLYFYLVKLSNRFGHNREWFWHSCSQLASITGLTEKTIRAAKKQLIEDDFIESRPGAYDPKYTVRHPCWFRIKGYEELPKELSWK